MKKDNWKLIKKLISNYDKKKNVSGEGGDKKCIPVFAYKNTSPVPVNNEFIDIFNKKFLSNWEFPEKKPLEPKFGRYDFLLTSVKKNINTSEYFYTKIVINKTDGDEEPIVEEKLFLSELELFEYKNFICVPNRIFQVGDKDIIIFDGSEVGEKEYLEIVDKWINQTNKP